MTFEKYSNSLIRFPKIGFSLDLSRMDISEEFLASMQPKAEKALADLALLEAGDIANPDEGRMVGHYWLLNPDLAPTPEIKAQITEPLAALKEFAKKVHTGQITNPWASVKVASTASTLATANAGFVPRARPTTAPTASVTTWK